MNQSKFSLADLFTVLAAVIFGFFCFLSLNFLSLGETTQSITWAIILSLVLGGLAFLVKLLKKTSRNFRTCIIWEWILLFVFVSVALVAVFPFSHYFAVSEQKEEIRARISANIVQAEGMFAKYEADSRKREADYRRDLKSAVAAKIVQPTEYTDKYVFENNIDDNTQIENKMFTLHAKLFPTNYAEMKKQDSAWLAKARNTVENMWSWTFGVVNIVTNVEGHTKQRLIELTQLSSYKAKGEAVDGAFNYPLTFDDVTKKFTELRKPTTISISLAIALYLLMLLSYFISKRSTKTLVGKKTKSGMYSIDY